MNHILRLFFSFLLLAIGCVVHADRYVFNYDASGNRVSSEKEILIRGEDLQDSDSQPRRQNLSLRQITIHPNPTQGQLRVEISGGDSFQGASITIYSVSGSVVYYDSEPESVNDIDLTQCANGIYLLIIRIDGETSSWKIIKI